MMDFDTEYKVTYEELDSVLVNTIAPACFMCRNLFKVNEVVVKMKVPTQLTMRFHEKLCWEYFQIGIELFEEMKHEFKPQREYLI